MITNTDSTTDSVVTPQGDSIITPQGDSASQGDSNIASNSNTDRPFAGTVTASIDERLAQIEAERARITQLDEGAARLRHEKAMVLAARRREVIQTIPALLQVLTIEEAITLMRAEVSPTKSNAKGKRYSDAVRAQVKQMMVAKTPLAQIAKHMRISEATLWIWKKYWGLTKAREAVVATPKVAKTRRAKRGVKTPLTEQQKGRLVSLLKEGKTPAAVLAKEFGLSRARIYQIVAQQGLTTPGLQHAA